MREIVKFSQIFLITVLMLFVSVVSASDQNQHEERTQVSKMKIHRFPGGICYLQRKNFEPDFVTFNTTTLGFMAIGNIQKCIALMLKNKWEVVREETTTAIDVLFEARTENMFCLQVGQIQKPMLFQIRFSNLVVTGKQDEIIECLAKATLSKNKVQQQPADYRSNI